MCIYKDLSKTQVYDQSQTKNGIGSMGNMEMETKEANSLNSLQFQMVSFHQSVLLCTVHQWKGCLVL